MDKIPAIVAYFIVGFAVCCVGAVNYRERCGSPVEPSIFIGGVILWGLVLPLSIADQAIYGTGHYSCDP